MSPGEKARRIVAVAARLSNQLQRPSENPRVSNLRMLVRGLGFGALFSATTLTCAAFSANAACAGADDFVATAYRTGDSHEDAAKCDHDPLGMAIAIPAVFRSAGIVRDHVDHFFVGRVSQISDRPVYSFFLDLDNFLER